MLESVCPKRNAALITASATPAIVPNTRFRHAFLQFVLMKVETDYNLGLLKSSAYKRGKSADLHLRNPCLAAVIIGAKHAGEVTWRFGLGVARSKPASNFRMGEHNGI